MRVQRNVVVFTLTVMRTFNVSVTGKVRSHKMVAYSFLFKCFITGILCGKCQHGKGISVLLNNCKYCGAENLLLIPALGTYF